MPANDGLHAWSAGRLLGLMECPAGSSSVLGHRKPDPVDQLVSQFLRLFHGCRRLPQRTRIRSETDDAEHHPGDSCDNEGLELIAPATTAAAQIAPARIAAFEMKMIFRQFSMTFAWSSI
jgi:hypothetical protein